MANLAWDVIKAHPIIASGGTASGSFAVPRAATVMTIHLPVTMTGTTLSVQALDPQDSTTWNTISWVPDGSATPIVFTITFGAGRCLVASVSHFGGGNLRLVSGSAEAAERVFSVLFTKSD